MLLRQAVVWTWTARPLAHLRRSGLCAALVLASACSAGLDDGGLAGAEASRDRTTLQGRSSAGALVQLGGLVCSTVLVADRLILTAGHCIPEDFSEIRAFFDSPATPTGADWKLIDARWAPDFSPRSLQGDLALAVLSTDATTAPISIASTLALSQPQPLLLIGFGGPAYPPFVRSAGGVIASESETESGLLRLVPSPAQACHGDSGAPVVTQRGELVGIVSRGAPGCDAEFVATELKRERLDWIESFARELGAAVSWGERCWFDEQCAGGSCIAPRDAPGRRYCAPACRAAMPCPAAMTCDQASGKCLFPVPSPGSLGMTCEEPWDCGIGACGRPIDAQEVNRCMRPCAGLDLGCPEGERCVAAELRGSGSPWRNVCVPP